MACIAAVAGIGWLILDDGGGGKAASVSTTASASTTPTPTPTPSPTESTTSPTPSPTPAPTSSSSVSRTGIAVSVLNNTGTPGAAGVFAAKVKNAGWTVGGVGNWRGSVPGNTVYYPPGHEAEAAQLGKDVGITRIQPRVDPMRADRLTIILAGPQ